MATVPRVNGVGTTLTESSDNDKKTKVVSEPGPVVKSQEEEKIIFMDERCEIENAPYGNCNIFTVSDSTGLDQILIAHTGDQVIKMRADLERKMNPWYAEKVGKKVFPVEKILENGHYVGYYDITMTYYRVKVIPFTINSGANGDSEETNSNLETDDILAIFIDRGWIVQLKRQDIYPLAADFAIFPKTTITGRYAKLETFTAEKHELYENFVKISAKDKMYLMDIDTTFTPDGQKVNIFKFIKHIKSGKERDAELLAIGNLGNRLTHVVFGRPG